MKLKEQEIFHFLKSFKKEEEEMKKYKSKTKIRMSREYFSVNLVLLLSHLE